MIFDARRVGIEDDAGQDHLLRQARRRGDKELALSGLDAVECGADTAWRRGDYPKIIERWTRLLDYREFVYQGQDLWFHDIELSLNSENGVVVGEAEILPTQLGRNLAALLETSCKAGVSSRGYGMKRGLFERQLREALCACIYYAAQEGGDFKAAFEAKRRFTPYDRAEIVRERLMSHWRWWGHGVRYGLDGPMEAPQSLVPTHHDTPPIPQTESEEDFQRRAYAVRMSFLLSYTSHQPSKWTAEKNTLFRYCVDEGFVHRSCDRWVAGPKCPRLPSLLPVRHLQLRQSVARWSTESYEDLRYYHRGAATLEADYVSTPQIPIAVTGPTVRGPMVEGQLLCDEELAEALNIELSRPHNEGLDRGTNDP